MQRLGGRVLTITPATSSTQKGESLADTIRTLGCYSDAIVLRHPEASSAATAAKYSPVPIINGGNGSVEHPTQAFLDLFTIREELGTVNGLRITFIGDLKYGRTVHSLLQLLEHYTVTIALVAAPGLELPSDLREQLIRRGQLAAEATALDDSLVSMSDVLYVTRVQKERFADPEEYARVKDGVRLDNKSLLKAKNTAVVMHPLPRREEVDEVVRAPASQCF
jgi:carbamoyl-phosphate synthase/aspartate carbamoyltransferase